MKRYQKKINRCERGVTVIELLAATALGAVIGTGILNAVAAVVSYYQSVNRAANARAAIALLEHEIDTGMRLTAVRAGIAALRVHPDGVIRSASGVRHRIHTSSAALRPRPQSAAISFLHLESDRQFVSEVPGYFCEESTAAAGGALPAPVQTDNWLAVSPDYYYQAVGRAERVRASAAAAKSLCPGGGRPYRLELRPASFLIFASANGVPPAVPSAVLLALPIADIYSIYLSESGELRRLSLASGENQPLGYGMEELLITAENAAARRWIVTVSSRALAPTGRFSSLTIPLESPEPVDAADLAFAW